MAVYYVDPCQGGSQLQVDDNGLTLSLSDVISFSSSTGDVTCGTVGAQLVPPPPIGPSSYTAITIFDKHWASLSDPTREAIWKYMLVLCKLVEKARVAA